jgi:hypothetical protein
MQRPVGLPQGKAKQKNQTNFPSQMLLQKKKLWNLIRPSWSTPLVQPASKTSGKQIVENDNLLGVLETVGARLDQILREPKQAAKILNIPEASGVCLDRRIETFLQVLKRWGATFIGPENGQTLKSVR